MTDGRTTVRKMFEVDPVFADVCKTLFGDEVSAQDVWDYAYEVDVPAALVSKMSPDPADVSTMGGRLKRIAGNRWAQAGTAGAAGVAAGEAHGRSEERKKGRPVLRSRVTGNPYTVGKADSLDVVWEGEFSKMDEDKRQVFGWASVVEVNGEPVVDRQGDMISPEEMEKAAYDYVLRSRKGGDMHRRSGEDPHHVSDMIESFVLTPEKIAKMGLPESTPVGWWVGFKVNDDSTWDLVKKGARTGFSIHGRGKRVPVE